MLWLVSAAVAGELAGDVRWGVDLGVTAALGVGFLATEFPAKEALAPETCHWCQPSSGDLAIREALRWQAPEGADRASDVLASGVVPVGSLVAACALRGGGDWRDGGRDALYVAEAVAVAVSVNQAAKFSYGRARPYVWAGGAGASAYERADDNLSFYSAHTSIAFSAVSAATTVAWLRGDRRWWIPAALGFPLAATVGYLRIGADQHWASDVAVGAGVGAAIGFATPMLLHRRVGGVQVGVMGGGAPGVVVAGGW